MRTDIKIFFALVLIVLGFILLIQEFYIPIRKVEYEYSPTEFIEPLKRFLKCFEDTDCIKVKGSACPPSSGGREICVDKDYFQEYLSEVKEKAGSEKDVACPEIYLVTNRTCSCLEGECNLV